MKKKLFTGLATGVVLSSAIVPAINGIDINKNARTHTVQAATTQDEFLSLAAKQAQKAAKKYGVYPSVMIAQAIIESGWGQSTLATEANNLFGIKAGSDWNGATYTVKTREVINGKDKYVNAAFRKYNSYEESFEDNGKKLRLGLSSSPNFYKATWIENAATPAAVTLALTGTYATDPKYNQTLDKKISQYNLTQYDPTISKTTASYKVKKNAATYVWPTDHSVSAKSDSVKKGDMVTVDETITYYNGTKRMHIAGKGWVNSTVFDKKSASPVTQAPSSTKATKKTLMHNAYIYNSKAKRVKGTKTLKEDTVINTYGTKTIKGKKYYQVGKNQYVASGNIDGTLRLLKHNAYVYNGSGNRDNEIVKKKGTAVATFGKRVTIVGKKYYKIGLHQYVKVSNFA